MTDKEFIENLLESSKPVRKKMLYDYMIGLGFQVSTNNQHIHLFCRYTEFNLDLWPTVGKMNITIAYEFGRKRKYYGYHAIVTEINRLHKLYLED